MDFKQVMMSVSGLPKERKGLLGVLKEMGYTIDAAYLEDGYFIQINQHRGIGHAGGWSNSIHAGCIDSLQLTLPKDYDRIIKIARKALNFVKAGINIHTNII